MNLARAAAWHRQVAALVAAADRAGVAGAQLPTIRARLLAQQTGLAQAAAQARVALPALVPTPGEIAAAGAGFGDLSEAAIDHAVRTANQTLDAADAELTRPSAPPETMSRVALRNGLVYGGFSATVLALQVVLLIVADEASTLPMMAPLCLLGLPALAWLGGWLTVGAAFRRDTGGKVNRTPRLGVAICLMPNALLCAVLGVLFVARA